jgi:hypothetical protein
MNADKQELQRKMDNATAEALKKFAEFQSDEAYKEANCRLCPHCHRTVQKLEGCDSMKCGSDYHGGNNQHGCGQSFNWSQTQPYRRGNDTPNLPKSIKDVDPNAAAEVRHHLYVRSPGTLGVSISDDVSLKCEVMFCRVVGLLVKI